MDSQKIAIIGLGRIGSAFLRQLQSRQNKGVDVVCVAETGDTPGKQQALQAKIPLRTLDEIVAMGSGLDLIFDLTGLPEVRRELREKMMGAGNNHTVIASETIARLVFSLISSEALPVIEGRKTGY